MLGPGGFSGKTLGEEGTSASSPVIRMLGVEAVEVTDTSS